MWGIGFIIIILLLLAIHYYYKNMHIEPFIAVNDSNLYMPQNAKTLPETIKFQIPIPKNQLTDLQLQNIDTDILRQIRVLKNFSNTDELDFYQMYNLLKQYKTQAIEFTYNPSIDKKQIIINEKIELNTGAINNADLELFFRVNISCRSHLK